ncbi:MAG: STAS/SEC14 domain-containing protein [Sporocytophaga sp.]|uniref:STAS/SEC14 domain-containing protein n=1 Tax=Sporocytophaga sp. TaxID=2231183 RepID=UPI001B2719D6|nr:STAS/SEC14 domain-containing protein [Sporocytophaga sp.]MBO9702821.1 STAS/SEC14 domain-containing protein [Sporocytophaga sp.]
MDTKPVYDIFFNPELKAVVMNWHGYSTSRQLKEGSEKMLKTLIEHKANKVLANLKEMILISMEDQNWIEHSFIPRGTEKGFKAIAIIKPKSYFNRVAVENIASKIENRDLMIIKQFDNEGEAIAWLNQVEIEKS